MHVAAGVQHLESFTSCSTSPSDAVVTEACILRLLHQAHPKLVELVAWRASWSR